MISRHLTPLEAAVVVAVGLAAGVGVGLLVARGDLVAALCVVFGFGVLALALRPFDASVRRPLAAMLFVAYAGRLALMAVLHDALAATGHQGHLFGDDQTYEWISWQIAQYWRGQSQPIEWFGNAYLMGTYVYVEAAIFFLFGPQVTIVKVLNVTCGAGLVLIVFSLIGRLSGRRAAFVGAALVGFFPSLVLWSVLNLKEAIVLVIVVGIVLLVVRHAHAGRTWLWLLTVFVGLALLESLRKYLFWMIGAGLPLAILCAPRPRIPTRAIGAVGCAAIAVALWVASTNGLLGPSWFSDPLVRYAFVEAGLIPERARLPGAPVTLENLDRARAVRAAGARTAFTEPQEIGSSIAANPGQRFQVQEATPTPTVAASATPPETSTRAVAPTSTLAPTVTAPTAGPTATAPSAAPSAAGASVPPVTGAPTTAPPLTASAVTPTPTIVPPQVIVSPGERVVLVKPDATPPPSAPGVVIVRPGDIVAVRGVSAPEGTPTMIRLEPGREVPVESRSSADARDSIRIASDLLRYLPKGTLYAIAAPFPWDAVTLMDRITVPEMLAWYPIVVAAVWGAWLLRHRWREAFLLYALTAGIFLSLAISEGNTGTLFRHRDMVQPFVFVLAAPVLVRCWDRLRIWIRR